MPPKKSQKKDPEAQEVRPSRKRQLPVDPYEVPEEIEPPKRRRRSNPTEQQEEVVVNGTPTKRRGRPPKAAAAEPINGPVSTTPSALRQKNAVETPVKINGINGAGTPGRKTIADRSARKKSARALVDRLISGAISDDEAEDGDIAREIYESSEEEEEEEDEGQEETREATTPSKTGRGRPKGTAAKSTTRRKRSPTPPRNLPPHEQFFYQNKPGLAKTSNNTLSSLDLLTHDEYFSVLRKLKDPHEADVNFLLSLHAESFPQWAFELSQGFSTCLYGYGSKRKLVHNFAAYLSSSSSQPPDHRIVIINGYIRTLTAREILSTLSTAILPPSKGSLTTAPTLPALLSLLSSSPSVTLTILLNSIDSPSLRKPSSQSLLSTLAAHPQIRLCCTADSPDFPLLWDSALRSSFNFVFHDCTTFAKFSPSELEVVDEVHELLNRKTRRVGGKEGVAFVLRSLPENAKNLFRLLVGEVLVALEEQGGGGEEVAVEYRMVYQKAVEEFICSSEMAFRTLLKEFHDHQIITSHKDSLGTELLSLPFRKDELESILEELMS
ncbi:hypothetical protein QBC44DRAFT_273302 [Cladorrhinum sp. PSN332]|nr:hypothetical protein QBC44DRAFT_273302 [Cladorrhinum sp. PSN332]